MAQTDLQYYSSATNYGKYAYVSLTEIINDLLLDTTDPDHYLKNVKRARLVQKAKEGIRILNREVKKTILMAEITVGPSHYLPLPKDYIDWVRVSVIGSDHKLYPLRQNNNIPTAVGYLQDDNYDYLFDNNGKILRADSSNIFNKGYKRINFSEYKRAGDFVIDERRGVIGFDEELEDKEILIEYISDGLQMETLEEEEITIHKNIRETLLAYTFWACINGRLNVPRNAKYDALNRYKALLHTSKLDNLNFNIAQLKEGMRVEYRPYVSS